MKISNFVTNCAITFTVVTTVFCVVWAISGSHSTTIQGVVQLDGQAVPWADVVFIPEDPTKDSIAVKADRDGQYQLNDTVPSGAYRVVARGTASDGLHKDMSRMDELDEYQQQMVMELKLQQMNSAKRIPKSYGTAATSPLRTNVVEGEVTDFHLKLTTSGKQVATGKTNQSTTVR